MNPAQPRFETLPGLPGTGPLPLQFSRPESGTHREGLVVRFHPASGPPWIGNFQHGLTDLDSVTDHPNRDDVIVIAHGEGYIVSPETANLAGRMGSSDTTVMLPLPERRLVVLAGWGHMDCVGPGGLLWRSDRLFLDALRNVRVEGDWISAEAWEPENRWSPLQVNLLTGQKRRRWGWR